LVKRQRRGCIARRRQKCLSLSRSLARSSNTPSFLSGALLGDGSKQRLICPLNSLFHLLQLFCKTTRQPNKVTQTPTNLCHFSQALDAKGLTALTTF